MSPQQQVHVVISFLRKIWKKFKIYEKLLNMTENYHKNIAHIAHLEEQIHGLINDLLSYHHSKYISLQRFISLCAKNGTYKKFVLQNPLFFRFTQKHTPILNNEIFVYNFFVNAEEDNIGDEFIMQLTNLVYLGQNDGKHFQEQYNSLISSMQLVYNRITSAHIAIISDAFDAYIKSEEFDLEVLKIHYFIIKKISDVKKTPQLIGLKQRVNILYRKNMPNLIAIDIANGLMAASGMKDVKTLSKHIEAFLSILTHEEDKIFSYIIRLQAEMLVTNCARSAKVIDPRSTFMDVIKNFLNNTLSRIRHRKLHVLSQRVSGEICENVIQILNSGNIRNSIPIGNPVGK